MMHATRQRGRERASRGWLGVACAAVLLAGCGAEAAIVATLYVVDDSGAARQVEVALADRTYTTNAAGMLRLELAHPVLAVVRCSDCVPEPVMLGYADHGGRIEVRVWRALGGQRYAMHAAGDVMFGRRYEAPTSGEPLLAGDVAAAAVAVVTPIQRLFTAATLRTLNLETVISRLPVETKYPGKRFILNSAPETLAAVKALAVDMVGFSNNHTRDYLDAGVAESVAHLDAAGLAWQGAAVDGAQATPARFLQQGAVRIGFLHYTTVNGDFVNDAYPTDGKPQPTRVAETEAWQWEARAWGFAGEGWVVPVEARRIGSAWRLFRDQEGKLSAADLAGAWASLMMVYPELQDWVARRGHGGAAPWLSKSSPKQITATKAEAQLLVVQLHAGFQFQPAPSGAVRDNARKAIEAGADIVICHHPHVLQGAEWYRGKLIVYSLGNFVFDQDFFATYASAILRTVWDGAQLVEAKFLPVEIIGYQPRPLVDAAATKVLLGLAEMSLAGAEAARIDGGVRVFPAPELPETKPADIVISQHTGRLSLPGAPPVPEQALTESLGPGEVATLPMGLYRGTAACELGRELLRWGDFEHEVADAPELWGAHWVLADEKKFVVQGGAPQGRGYLRLLRTARNQDVVLVRPVARVPLTTHRRYLDEDGDLVGQDAPARYSVRAKVRRRGDGAASLRLELYDFDDTNPTEDPSSASLGVQELALEVPADGAWHDLELPVPEALLTADGLVANMVMLYLGLGVPSKGEATLDVDDLMFVEWRAGNEALPPAAHRLLRNPVATAQACPLWYRPPQ